jgi:hypothetical protein
MFLGECLKNARAFFEPRFRPFFLIFPIVLMGCLGKLWCNILHTMIPLAHGLHHNQAHIQLHLIHALILVKPMALGPNVISATSCKCVACFEVAWCRFSRMGIVGPKANQHGNMSCFNGGLVFVSTVGNRMPWNMSLETWTLKPTTHQNMPSFDGWPNMRFNA